MLTKREVDAKRARAALGRGTSWKAVAKRYSIDAPFKRAGGKVPAQAKNTLDRRLGKAIFSAVQHRLVAAIQTQYGYWVFTVTRVEPARQRQLGARSRRRSGTRSPRRPSKRRSTPSSATSRHAGERRPSALRDTGRPTAEMARRPLKRRSIAPNARSDPSLDDLEGSTAACARETLTFGVLE